MDLFELGRLVCGLVIFLTVLAAGTFLTYGYGRWWR